MLHVPAAVAAGVGGVWAKIEICSNKQEAVISFTAPLYHFFLSFEACGSPLIVLQFPELAMFPDPTAVAGPVDEAVPGGQEGGSVGVFACGCPTGAGNCIRLVL